jgi:cGMP-dependent protein kinase
MFGNVFLSACPTKQTLYALKTMSRGKITKYKIQENIQLERSILLQLDHTFILKLVKTYKDNRRIYLLTEFVKGMDLFDVLRELGLCNDRDAKFYAACLVEILGHLHERDIVYRDLKPENIMVDEQGYLKLIDFGTAKFVNGRTFTIVGTPHYMAPEVIVGKGYGLNVDLWSLGVILYEFLCGGVPFGEEEDDPYAIYERVLERRLRYPNFLSSNFPAKPLIELLLDKNPSMRNLGSYDALRGHEWFLSINF